MQCLTVLYSLLPLAVLTPSSFALRLRIKKADRVYSVFYRHTLRAAKTLPLYLRAHTLLVLIPAFPVISYCKVSTNACPLDLGAGTGI